MFDHRPRPSTTLSNLELEDELVDLAAQINAATCRWLELAAEFDRRGVHEAFGFVSCATWLAWRCSLTPRAAREQLRVARDLEGLPKIHAEFAAGRLSYSKVRALTRVAEGIDEEDLIELAQDSTAAQLERLIRAYRRATADDDELAQERRHLTTFWEDDGTLSVRGNLPADEAALFMKALEVAREELFASYVSDAKARTTLTGHGHPPGAPNRADALVALAETTISKGAQAASGGDRHQVVIHVDASQMPEGGSAEPPEPKQLEIDRATVEGIPLSPEATKRLACDASIVELREKDGEPLSVGRKTRSIPPAIRRALNSRDRCCAFPGCEQERFVDAHHIKHWADGGETRLDNLVLLCRRHHRLLHEGGVTIEGDAKAPRFLRPNGCVIEPSPALPSAGSRDPLRRFAPSGPVPWGKGEPMDLDLAVFVLAHRHEKRRDDGSDPPPPVYSWS